MRNKLEFKILSLIFGIIIISIFASSAGVLYMVRSDMYSVAVDTLEGTSKVVMTELERSMISGNPEVTKELLYDLRKIEDSLEVIEVLNSEGREAFNPEAPIT
ncbi:MAG: hypothetical protein GTN76_08750, partial [Candidatus Aenigmarchaeota archaeon]|nr:hypothetical protein [Candidatus Aenigmarchaeota archaeon]